MGPKMQLAIWIAQPILESVLAGIMIRRKLHRQFPIFFLYILSQVLSFAILFPIHQRGASLYTVYFYAYWACAAVSLAIGFKVIHEVFLDVFRPYYTLKDLGTVLFKWAALVMLLVALVVAASSPDKSSLPITQAVVTVERCVRVIQCGLILFLLLFSRYLGVSWRQHSFGIALGFGGFAIVELCAIALYSGHQIHPDTQNALIITAYFFSILTWISYAAFKAPAREAPATLLTSQRWEQSLTDLQAPSAGDSLIPMFEGMVERAFSRAPNNSEQVVERQVLTLSELSKPIEPPASTPKKR